MRGRAAQAPNVVFEFWWRLIKRRLRRWRKARVAAQREECAARQQARLKDAKPRQRPAMHDAAVHVQEHRKVRRDRRDQRVALEGLRRSVKGQSSLAEL